MDYSEGNALLGAVLAGDCPVEVLADWLVDNFEDRAEKGLSGPRGIDLEADNCGLWFSGSQGDSLLVSVSFNPTGSSGNWQGESWAECTAEKVAGFLSRQLKRVLWSVHKGEAKEGPLSI